MFKPRRARLTTASLLLALGVVACGGRQLAHRDEQPDGAAGNAGAFNSEEGAKTPSGGGQAGGDDGEASGGSAGGVFGGGAGSASDGASELGGAGAANQTPSEEAAAALEATVEAALRGSTWVTSVNRIAEHTFELRDCIGPYEPVCDGGPCDDGSAWIDDPFSDDMSYDQGKTPFCPKLTLHFIAVDDELALIVEMPTQTFPYAEQLKLEQRGDIWRARGIATSTRLALRNEDPQWVTDYYKAAFAVFAFADDNDDGEPDRVVTAATNSTQGSLLLGGRPIPTGHDEYRRYGWVNWGEAEGVAVSQGASARLHWVHTATELTTHGIFLNGPQGLESLETPGFPPERAQNGRSEGYVSLGGAHHVFALGSAVQADSVFFLENAQGERSMPKPISIRPIEGYEANGRYIHGLLLADGLTGDWDLVGEGTTLNGKPFALRQSFTLRDSSDGGAGGAGNQ